MKSKEKIYYEVQVSYDLKAGLTDYDKKLEEWAAREGGTKEGSGAGFGARDVQFAFDAIGAAMRFVDRVQRSTRAKVEDVVVRNWESGVK